MKKKFALLAALLSCIFYYLPVTAHKPVKLTAKNQSLTRNKTALVCISFEKIYDINVHDHEYKIDFWCTLVYPKKDTLDFRNHLQVAEAKEMIMTVVDSSVSGADITVLLKLTCKMFYKWELKGFPFDRQELKIVLYHVGRNVDKFNFVTDDHGLHNGGRVELENGWHLHCSDSVLKPDSIAVSFREPKEHSSVAFNLDIHREYSWGLFFKLFIGMYVACIVAFFALFIDTNKHFEPRFSLLVGALFAAIANKYIVEGILPESPSFNLVDRLHTLTFCTITIIILFSVIALYHSRDDIQLSRKNKRRLLLWTNRKAWFLLLLCYILLSAIFICGAVLHQHGQPVLPTDTQVEHPHSG